MHGGGWCWLDAGRAAQINPSTGADKAHIPPAASSSYRPVQSALQRFHSHHLIFIYFSPFLGCVLLPSPSILFFSHLKRKKGGEKNSLNWWNEGDHISIWKKARSSMLIMNDCLIITPLHQTHDFLFILMKEMNTRTSVFLLWTRVDPRTEKLKRKKTKKNYRPVTTL